MRQEGCVPQPFVLVALPYRAGACRRIAGMADPNVSLATWLIVLPLVLWRMVSRFRHMTQRQRITRVRPWVTLTLFPLLLFLLAMTAFVPPHPPQPEKLVWLVLGIAAGGALAIYGLKRTRFEATAEGVFYTPDAKLGMGLSLLFLARILYRFGELALVGVRADEGLDFALSPWTLGPVGLFSGYFIVYAIGLLWQLHSARPKRCRLVSPPARPTRTTCR
jgi:hypothetical protein